MMSGAITIINKPPIYKWGIWFFPYFFNSFSQALMLCCYEIAKQDFPSPSIKSEKIAKQSDYAIFEKEFQNFLKKVPRPPVLNDKNCMEYFNEIKAKSALTTREVYFLKSLLVRTLKLIK